LERIAEFSKNDRDAISAINTLLDRGHGRAPQPHDGDGEGGPITIKIITQVPVPDDG
jgi:hypothetical protein